MTSSEYFHSTKINCPGDSRRESKRGGVAFPHVVVGATLLRAARPRPLPVDVEEVRKLRMGVRNSRLRASVARQASSEKATLRSIGKRKMCVVGDDQQLRTLHSGAHASCGWALCWWPSRIPIRELFEWVEELDRMGECIREQVGRRPGAHVSRPRASTLSPIKCRSNRVGR